MHGREQSKEEGNDLSSDCALYPSLLRATTYGATRHCLPPPQKEEQPMDRHRQHGSAGAESTEDVRAERRGELKVEGCGEDGV